MQLSGRRCDWQLLPGPYEGETLAAQTRCGAAAERQLAYTACCERLNRLATLVPEEQHTSETVCVKGGAVWALLLRRFGGLRRTLSLRLRQARSSQSIDESQ